MFFLIFYFQVCNAIYFGGSQLFVKIRKQKNCTFHGRLSDWEFRWQDKSLNFCINFLFNVLIRSISTARNLSTFLYETWKCTRNNNTTFEFVQLFNGLRISWSDSGKNEYRGYTIFYRILRSLHSTPTMKIISSKEKHYSVYDTLESPVRSSAPDFSSIFIWTSEVFLSWSITAVLNPFKFADHWSRRFSTKVFRGDHSI